jgi:hypothetical protein
MIVTINGIQVAIDLIIEPNVEGLIIDLSGDKNGLSLLGDTGNCC